MTVDTGVCGSRTCLGLWRFLKMAEIWLVHLQKLENILGFFKVSNMRV